MRTELTTPSRPRAITALEVACGAGALNDGCGEGPAEFRRHGDPELRIRAATFLGAWSELTRDRRCLGIEIAEYDPRRDQSGRTARLIGNLISAGLKERIP